MKKPISLLLTTSLLLSVFALTSCNKKDGEDELANCDWYKSSSYELDLPFEGYRDNFFYCDSCAIEDKVYIASIEMGYPSEYVEDCLNGNSDSIPEDSYISYTALTEVDANTGEVLNKYNISELVEDMVPSDTIPDYLSIAGLLPDGDGITIYFSNYGYIGSSATERLESVDFNTADGSLSNYQTYDDIVGNSMEGSSLSGILKVKDMDLVFISKIGATGDSYSFVFVEDGDVAATVDLESFCDDDIYKITGMLVDGNSLYCSYESYGAASRGVVTINLDSFTGSVSSDNAAIANNPNCSLLNGEDCYSPSAEGIYKYNSESKEMDLLVDYNYSDINIYDARNSSILACTETRIIMLEIDYVSSTFINGNPAVRLTVVDKSDENPYEGRTALTVADVSDSIDYATSEAIRNFNRTNTEYYITLRIYRDDLALSGLYALSDVTNRVLIDIANGDAPDVILNGASYNAINNSDVLLDLSEYVAADQSINSDNYFMNIIDAAYTDGKLYQIPLRGNIVGVRSLESANSDYSFSYDEYEDFIATATNGYDPISEYCGYDRLSYTNELLGPQLNTFVNYAANEADFNHPDFINTVEFISNAPMMVEEDLDFDGFYMDSFLRNNDAYYGELTPFMFFRTQYHLGSDIKVSGVGANDTGAEFKILTSAAISASCDNPEGAWQFIQMLMSDDIMSLGNLDSVPVNRSAFNNVMNDLVDKVDEEIVIFKATSYYTPTHEDIEMYALAEITDADLANYEENISNINTIYSTDAEIMLVIQEEISAYYEGQKTVDEAITTINDRVSTILEERN